jgi:hypothetical protein
VKYTKKEIDDLLSLQSSWTLEGKQRSIKRSFRKFNGQTNTATTQKKIDHAEMMMEVCAQAMQTYKEPPHKRNYQKKVKPKKKPRKKYVAKKTTPNNNGGCLIPIAISLSSFGLLIWMLIP